MVKKAVDLGKDQGQKVGGFYEYPERKFDYGN